MHDLNGEKEKLFSNVWILFAIEHCGAKWSNQLHHTWKLLYNMAGVFDHSMVRCSFSSLGQRSHPCSCNAKCGKIVKYPTTHTLMNTNFNHLLFTIYFSFIFLKCQSLLSIHHNFLKLQASVNKGFEARSCLHRLALYYTSFIIFYCDCEWRCVLINILIYSFWNVLRFKSNKIIKK